MIRGIGIDIEEVARFQSASPELLNRILSEEDRRYIGRFTEPAPHIAGIWAAKEALVKALGRQDLIFNQIAVLHSTDGKPYFSFCPDEGKLFLSIAHSTSSAVAVVVWEV